MLVEILHVAELRFCSVLFPVLTTPPHPPPPTPHPRPEHINEDILETSFFVFGLQWLFVPSYPVHQVVSFFGAGCFGEVFALIGVVAVAIDGSVLNDAAREQFRLPNFINAVLVRCSGAIACHFYHLHFLADDSHSSHNTLVLH
jgi:hypothetical protein